jgi:transposase
LRLLEGFKREEATVSDDQSIALLGGWEGHVVVAVARLEAVKGRAGAQVWIELRPADGSVPRCGGCRRKTNRIHDVIQRWVRDLPILEAQTRLLVHRRRVECARCGPKLEHLSWLAPYSRVTRRLAEGIARLCAVLPIKHVADFYQLGWDAVKRIDKTHLTEKLGPVDFRGVEVTALDEFAIQKGHRYATVVIDPLLKRVLWVGRGRSREEVRPFFALLGKEGCQRLQAAVMDMSPTYEEETRAHCPQAEIVYDLFHVVAKYGREVIDRVRIEEFKRVGKNNPTRKLIKGARWLLLRNYENVTRAEDRVRLSELLSANRALLTVYLLKDDLKHLWSYRSRGAAVRFWRQWLIRAYSSGIEPLKRFALNLKVRLSGVLAHCRWPFHTGLLEGINNKIKVIKRMAYGFRDDAYFFLKIRAAFPGIPG